jgi:hypothetical protein
MVVGLASATLEFWVRSPNERNQGKQGATLCYSTGFLTGPTIQAFNILPVAEEQSRTRCSQNGGVEDQLQCRGLLRINFNVEGCVIVAAPVHAPSRAPLLLPLLLSNNLPLPRIHQCVMGSLVHTSLGSSSLVTHVLHSPPESF